MAENYGEVGLVTHISGSEIYVWLMNAREERLFSAVVNKDMLKLAVWMHISKRDLEMSQISCVSFIPKPPVKTLIWGYSADMQKTVLVKARIVLPPLEWARKNGYDWFAYSFEFGRVGNFAYNKLLKLNNYKVRRDIVYEAILLRIPPNKFGRYVMNIFGSVWTILPRILPWRPSSFGCQLAIPPIHAYNANELFTCDSLENKSQNKPSNGFDEEIFDPLPSSKDCTPVAVDDAIMYVGVVILREPQYSIIWGKLHGFVAVSAATDLMLQPSNWVEYDCIEIDTEIGVPYLAITCVLSQKKPLVVEPHGNSIVAKVLIQYDVTKKWPCKLFAIYDNGTLKIIDWEQTDMESKILPEIGYSSDLNSILLENDRHQNLDSDKNTEKLSNLPKNLDGETYSESKAFMKDGNFGFEPNLDWLKQERCTVGAKILTLPVTILVKVTSAYGILWHINRKLIIVPAKYLGDSAKLGTWMKAKVSPLNATVIDLPYHFVVVRPLEKIDNKLMIRQIKNVLQNIYKFCSRISQEHRMKRFRTWVTFMSSELDSEPTWMITRRQRLVEVDQDGNELPGQSELSIQLTGQTSSSDGNNATEVSDDTVEGVPDSDSETS
uniref:DUF1618 domain-containing protein n=1 Tax=Setaria digitata TaxID=48799 RepID=A0A915PFI6_9BILA